MSSNAQPTIKYPIRAEDIAKALRAWFGSEIEAMVMNHVLAQILIAFMASAAHEIYCGYVDQMMQPRKSRSAGVEIPADLASELGGRG